MLSKPQDALIILQKVHSFTLLHLVTNFGHTFVILLCFLDLIEEGGFDLKICKKSLRDYIESKSLKFIIECGIFGLDHKTIAPSLSAQGSSNNVHLAWMIMNLQFIVLDQFKPSSLPHVEVDLSEDILETLVIGIDIAKISKEVVVLDF